jgi:hypothetical protein
VEWADDAADNPGGSGLAGYSTLWDNSPSSQPDNLVEHGAAVLSDTSPALADGTWYFHLSTCDLAGNCTTTLHLGPFYLDTLLPSDPSSLSSPSHTVGVVSSDNTVDVEWADDAADNPGGSGLAGYSTLWDSSPFSQPDTTTEHGAAVLSETSPALADGTWYFHLSTCDLAGNCTSTLHLGPFYLDATPGLFADVPVPGKEWMEPWIDAFYYAGITSGCGVNPLIYCPERVVTRAEMAVFVLRALQGIGYVPPPASHFFADVPVAGKEWMEPWIDEFYRRQITGGCGVNGSGQLIYCPERAVTRAEMAVLVNRAFASIPNPP